MLAVVLRYVGTRQLAGFYAAVNEDRFYDLIDQEHNAGDYEYAVISTGFGIEFRKGEYRTVKYKIGTGYDGSRRCPVQGRLHLIHGRAPLRHHHRRGAEVGSLHQD